MLGLTASGVLGEPIEIFPGIGLRKAIKNVKHSTKDNYFDQIRTYVLISRKNYQIKKI